MQFQDNVCVDLHTVERNAKNAKITIGFIRINAFHVFVITSALLTTSATKIMVNVNAKKVLLEKSVPPARTHIGVLNAKNASVTGIQKHATLGLELA